MVLCISVEVNYFEYSLCIKLNEIKFKRIYYHTIKKETKSLELDKRYWRKKIAKGFQGEGEDESEGESEGEGMGERMGEGDSDR